MTGLFRSRSCGSVRLAEFKPPSPIIPNNYVEEEEVEDDEEDEEDEEYEEEEDEEEQENIDNSNNVRKPISSPILDALMTALRKSLVTCSVETEDVVSSSLDISSPINVRHVSHVTFDRFNGFLGLPREFEPDLPRRVPSASASVFGVSAQSMQCSFDSRGNSVPTILLMMQKQLYSEGGLRAEGIFRINAENSQEEYVRAKLNRGVVPLGIDVHCLAGLIKAWLRELPTGVLDSLSPEQVMHCNTEDHCSQLVKLLPPTEADLLDWTINLMADVVQYEEYNKMNARNIAMVFAPNMTQMADPLTALIHAVQVMNFLKTLILKTLRERGEEKTDPNSSRVQSLEQCSEIPTLRSASLGRFEVNKEENYWSSEEKREGEDEEFESVSGRSTPPRFEMMGGLENEGKGGDQSGDWLRWRKGVRKICRNPVFQLSKSNGAKKSRSFGVLSCRDLSSNY